MVSLGGQWPGIWCGKGALQYHLPYHQHELICRRLQVLVTRYRNQRRRSSRQLDRAPLIEFCYASIKTLGSMALAQPDQLSPPMRSGALFNGTINKKSPTNWAVGIGEELVVLAGTQSVQALGSIVSMSCRRIMSADRPRTPPPSSTSRRRSLSGIVRANEFSDP